MGLLDLPAHERPRERLLSGGAGAVREDELLAIVLGTGRGSGEDALGLACRVLREGGGLPGLASASVGTLVAMDGVGPVKATRIAAAFELGRRCPGTAPTVGAGLAAPVSSDCSSPAAPPWQAAALAMRAQVAIGERALLAFRERDADAPVTLALGEALGPTTRAGSVLSRLITSPGTGNWWVVALRSGGPPQRKEREAAQRIAAAAHLVGLPFGGVVMMAGQRSHHLASASDGGPA